MGGPRAAFYIREQRRTFLLRMDEKCCSSPMYELNSKNVTAFEQIRSIKKRVPKFDVKSQVTQEL